jgi:LysR family transcriptional regulator for bpeEF and oprC
MTFLAMNISTNNPPVANNNALASSFATSYAGVVAFMAVVTEGSFAKAGDRLGIGRSAVSRGVQKLEGQLGARLFRRTTRSISLTREGDLFYAHCHPGVKHISQALEGMRELREGPPRGQLRICSTVGFGRKVVAPQLGGFHAAYPEIELDLILEDAPVDFAADRIDVSFRDGRLEDSQIVAKRLLPMQMLICGSADYARTHGLPRSIDDLSDHRCITFRSASTRIHEWEFMIDGHPQRVLPQARLTFNDVDLVLQAVLDGRGIAQLPGYQVCDLVRNGRLATCLSDYTPDDRGHYLCYLSRQHLPSRIRVFIDYMTNATRALDLRCEDKIDRCGLIGILQD